jgi:hypothetical protein
MPQWLNRPAFAARATARLRPSSSITQNTGRGLGRGVVGGRPTAADHPV